jgi:phosphatidate cytidylyltransferase
MQITSLIFFATIAAVTVCSHGAPSWTPEPISKNISQGSSCGFRQCQRSDQKRLLEQASFDRVDIVNRGGESSEEGSGDVPENASSAGEPPAWPTETPSDPPTIHPQTPSSAELQISDPDTAAVQAPARPADVLPNYAAETEVPAAKVAVSSRLKNISERTGGALAILIPGTLFAWKCGKPGVLALVFLVQWGMYYETTKIVEDHYRISSSNVERPLKRQWIQKWWWFATIVMATSLRALVITADPLTSPQAYSAAWMRRISPSTVDLVAYGMTAIGLMKSVMGMALMRQAGPGIFRKHLAKMATCHFALLYLIGQSSFWILTIQEFGLSWVVYPTLLVIVNDTMAYICGCLIGRTKILPRLSPKKTVEGFLGAAVSTVAVSVPLLKYVIRKSGQAVVPGLVKHALILSTFCSIVAPFGGFLASAVKRAFNTKDFGSLIPGHGGVVDRFDCHLVTAPFVYLYLRQFWGAGDSS